MTDEKKLDRMYNKGYIQFRKFQDKATCPTCNLPDMFDCMKDSQWDEKHEKFIDVKHVHNNDNCFKFYNSIMLATHKDKKGKYLGEDRIMNLIDRGLEKLKQMDKQFTESSK